MKASFSETSENRQTTIQAIHTALDSGVRFFDTADIYAPSWNTFGHNEQILAEAIRSYSGDKTGLILATKSGITRGPGETWGRNASLDYLLRATEASAGRLQVSELDLWQHHRLDPNLTFHEQVENLALLRQRGIFKRLGVSNYNAGQLRKAVEIAGPIYSVQNQLNISYRQQMDVLAVCEELDIIYLPWSPMKGAGESEAAKKLAEETNHSPYAVAVSWLKSLSSKVLVMPGVTRAESVQDAIKGIHLELSADQLQQLNQSLPESLPLDRELISDQPKN